MIRPGLEFASAVGANGGQGKKLFALPDDEKSLIGKSCIDAVGGKFVCRPCINDVSRSKGGNVGERAATATASGHGGGNQKVATVHVRGVLKIQRRGW